MTNAGDVIACARQFCGVRFMHQGRSAAGLDCLGLLIITARTLEVHFEDETVDTLDIPTYGARPDTLLLKQKLDTHLTPIALSDVREGDIVVLKVDGLPQHLALITDYPMQSELGMIHAYAPARQVIEHRYDAQWRRQTYLAYRLPQLAG
jgi:NlpC/P60 family